MLVDVGHIMHSIPASFSSRLKEDLDVAIHQEMLKTFLRDGVLAVEEHLAQGRGEILLYVRIGLECLLEIVNDA